MVAIALDRDYSIDGGSKKFYDKRLAMVIFFAMGKCNRNFSAASLFGFVIKQKLFNFYDKYRYNYTIPTNCSNLQVKLLTGFCFAKDRMNSLSERKSIMFYFRIGIRTTILYVCFRFFFESINQKELCGIRAVPDPKRVSVGGKV